MRVLILTGNVKKGMLTKDSLAGAGKNKNGKGLTIEGQSKGDMKRIKKNLKKAGAKSAKVVVVK